MGKKSIFTMPGIVALLAVMCAGCVTSVPFQIQRLPTMNTLGIQRVSVVPFTSTDNSQLQRYAAALLTSTSLSRIQAIGHFNMIDASEINRLQSANQNIENYIDAIFSGQVISLTVKNSQRQETKKNDNGEEVSYTIYDRELVMSFNYSLRRTRDGSIIGIINKSGRRSDSNENSAELLMPENLVEGIVKETLSGLARDVAPYTVTEYRRLMKETSKDKSIVERAKNAEAQVKAGNYKIAQTMFLDIYGDIYSYPAAYNASLLIEFQGDLSGAAAFMQRVFDETGNSKALQEAARIRKAISDAGLAAAYRENQTRADSVTASMIDTLYSKMPQGTRAAFINNSQNEKELVETISSNIIAGLQSRGVIIVDRNNRGLIEAERNYQLMGNVNDDDLVRIGNEAGSSIFILVSVTGTSTTRRLSVRMLDIERGTVLYQSPQTDDMNL